VPSDPSELRAWVATLSGEQAAAIARQLLHSAGAAAADPLLDIMRNAEIELPAPPATTRALTIEVTLQGSKPRIWRRLVVAGDTRLDHLHDILQTALGWWDGHLHCFYPTANDRGHHFVTEFDIEEGDEGTLESTVRVDQVLREVGDRMLYDYDFGDGWRHILQLKALGPLDDAPTPRCTGGRRACPPEDIGGIHSYAELLEWYDADRSPDALPHQFDDVEHLEAWLPDGFDPAAFDADEVNAQLQATAAEHRQLDALAPELAALIVRLDPTATPAVQAALDNVDDRPLTDEEAATATEHLRVLLAAVGDGVQLTSAGYLPPALVSEVYAALELDRTWYGKGNREDLTPPVADLRSAATAIGLLRKAKGALTPTAATRKIGDDPAALAAHLTSRLPVGKGDVERESGWFALLGIAGGLAEDELRDFVAQLLTARGWTVADRPVSSWDAYHSMHPTLEALLPPNGLTRHDPSPESRRLAAQAIRR